MSAPKSTLTETGILTETACRTKGRRRFRHGLFLISLDFELYWGIRDKRSVEAYEKNLRGTAQAVECLLSLFQSYGIHATWSTVGFLFFEGLQQLRLDSVSLEPGYKEQLLSPYPYLREAEELETSLHFAPQCLRKISETPGQEIGTHTHSHFYCLEPGVTAASFREDLAAAVRAGQRCGGAPASLVFPRNQWRDDFLPELPKLGIHCYRGNENHWLYEAVSKADLSLWRRALKLLDSYLNITGHHTWGPLRCGRRSPLNLPASRFLRPHSRKLAALNPLKRRRITSAMKFAAQNNEAFHLWWHPHNFGSNLDSNLEFLRELLEEFWRLSDRYEYRSLTMRETAEGIENGSLLEPA